MDPDNTPDMLPPLGLLSELDDSLRAKLARAGRFAAVPVGTRLAIQGEPHQTLTVLLSGKAKVSCHAHGSHIELATILPGETVGEMNMIDPQKASADVEIIERADIWTIDDDQFTNIVQTDPHAAFLVLKWLGRLLCRRLRANADKMLAREELTRQTFREMDY